MRTKAKPMGVADLRDWLSWLIRVRIVIITFVLGIEITLQQVARAQNLTIVQVPMKYFLLVLVFWYLLDLIYHILLKFNADELLQSYLQVTLDTVMVSLVVYYTGSLDSYFYFLYPLTVLVASIILSRKGSYLIAIFCFLQAAAVLELPYYDAIPFYGLVLPALKDLQIKIVLNLAAFLGVAYLGSKLSESLRRTGDELKDMQALNQDIIESLRSGLITTNLQGHIVLANSTASEILQIPPIALTEKPIGILFPGAEVREPADLIRPRREVFWKCPDGTEKFLGWNVSPLSRNGQSVGYVYNFQDLTQMKKLEGELQFKDRMAAIGRMAAGIAHEIRNPLASIAGSVKLFSGVIGPDQEEHKLIQIVLKESERLNSIITNFLLYSREMTFQFAPNNLNEILEETITLLKNQPRFDERYHVELDLPPRPVIATLDADRMRQVFWNLGDNALKAMPTGGTLRVRLQVEADRLRIEFVDTGGGIAPRHLEKIFEPFQSEFEGGTGLGLAIVYQIVQAHKGTIRAEAVGTGCAFYIELPFIGSESPDELETANERR